MNVTAGLLLSLLSANPAPPAAAQPECAGTPSAAVLELPMPLAKWAKLSCTPFGHVIESRSPWVWTTPGSYDAVFMPAQMVRSAPLPGGNHYYFTNIELARVEGAEFTAAYDAYHQGLAKDAVMPLAYRLNLTSVSGKSNVQYFFDYGDHAWGIWCNGTCDTSSRFMLIDMSQRPGKAD
jgi:hypothetical protein